MAQQLLDSAAQTQNLAHDLIFAIRDFRDTLAHHLEFLSKSDLRPEKTWKYSVNSFWWNNGSWDKSMKEKLFDEQEPLGAVPARKFTFGDQPAAKANEPGAENNASPAAEKPADDEYLFKKKYPWEVDYLELLPNFGDFLGEGTYAEVYTANWKGNIVAVKKFKPWAGQDEESLRKEIHLLSSLDHPNVLKFVGACTKFPNICLLTEYCSMGSLRNLLKDDNIVLNWPLKINMARDVARALEYLHSKKIIHRDIKAGNVLVNDRWEVKVCDFGLAKLKSEMKHRRNISEGPMAALSPQPRRRVMQTNMNVGSTHVTTWAGTTGWISPELHEGKPYNESTDVYSYGVLLWEILTRKPVPFPGKDEETVKALVKAGVRPVITPEEEASAPPGFVDLIKACWAQKPEDRPTIQTILERLDQMAALYKEEPMLTFKVPVMQPNPRK